MTETTRLADLATAVNAAIDECLLGGAHSEVDALDAVRDAVAERERIAKSSPAVQEGGTFHPETARPDEVNDSKEGDDLV